MTGFSVRGLLSHDLVWIKHVNVNHLHVVCFVSFIYKFVHHFFVYNGLKYGWHLVSAGDTAMIETVWYHLLICFIPYVTISFAYPGLRMLLLLVNVFSSLMYHSDHFECSFRLSALNHTTSAGCNKPVKRGGMKWEFIQFDLNLWFNASVLWQGAESTKMCVFCKLWCLMCGIITRSTNSSHIMFESNVAEVLYTIMTFSGGRKFGRSVLRGTIINTGSFFPFALADKFVFSFPEVYDGTVCEPIVSYV